MSSSRSWPKSSGDRYGQLPPDAAASIDYVRFLNETEKKNNDRKSVFEGWPKVKEEQPRK